MAKKKKQKPEDLDYYGLLELRREQYAPKKTTEGWRFRNYSIRACDYDTALLSGFKNAETPEEMEFFFWEIADLWWNQDPEDMRFIRNKWSHRIIHHLCRERWVAIGGAASAGKSYVLAGWSIIFWACDPSNTLVLVTSESLGGSRKRIYGAIKKLLTLVPDAPCKVKDSVGVISYFDGKQQFDTAGIQIVTADKSKDAQAMGKLVGAKAPRVLLVADEHDEMGFNVTAAAKGNLSKNERFQMASLSNPGSRFGPFGEMAEPEFGWNSIDTNVETEWRTKVKGVFLRLISEESPNIDQTPSNEYMVGEYTPGVVTQDQIDDDLHIPGVSPDEVRKTRNFMRFHSATFFDGDSADTVYTDAEIMMSGALKPRVIKNPTRCAGVDPSYSDGGDNTCMVVFDEGFDETGQHCIQFVALEYIVEDVLDKVNPRTLQIAEKIKALCKKYSIKYENLGIDASSGSGQGICDMLRLQIDSNAFLRVQFGGSASDKRISASSKITGRQRYKNRATELFMQGKQYLLGRQIGGLPQVIVRQMCQRTLLEPTKGEHGLVYQIERKKDYKARVGSSPDEADAFFVCVEVARERRLFTPSDPVPQKAMDNYAAWLQGRKTHSSFSADKMGFVGNL